MKNKILKRFGIIVLIALLAGTIALPGDTFGDNFLGKRLQKLQIALGLDLAGGTELDYKIDLSDAIAQNNDDDPNNNVSLDQIAESVRDALEVRVNPAGVGEISVKRSQVDDEEHVLIQMPPNTDVAQAKADASRDNRLEFFEEDPDLEKAARLNFATKLVEASKDWDTVIEETKQEENTVYKKIDEGRFQDEIGDTALAEKLFALSPGQVTDELIESQTEIEYTLGEDGNLQLEELPKPFIGFARLNTKTEEVREKKIPEEATARHILFGYPEATRAAADIKYQSKEEAQAEAQKLLEKLQTEGTDNFAELAKELSTEAAAQSSGGNLGSFGRGRMVGEFEEAVFGQATVGLIPKVVETEFGFHVIEVTNYQAETTKSVTEPKITYETFGWETDSIKWKKTKLSGAQLDVASVSPNELGKPSVALLFNDKGGQLFTEITDRVAKRSCDGGLCAIGIKVGGQWTSIATVRQKITGRTALITGNFTYDEAKQLANNLNLGAIDAPVKLSGQNTIRPELGEEQLNKSLKAGALGFLATILFMIVSYRLAGVVAGIALLIYVALFIMILKIWPNSFGGPIVLSLSGMAGIALSIGLAVDGNILIFERLKEEIARGKGLHQAIDLGFERAWSAIRDSNMTTLITCLILYNLGSAMIRGFAITLIVGTLLSMFTAITVSRTLLHTLLLNKAFQKTSLFGAKVEQTKKKAKTKKSSKS